MVAVAVLAAAGLVDLLALLLGGGVVCAEAATARVKRQVPTRAFTVVLSFCNSL
jgi:hypothetical protein